MIKTYFCGSIRGGRDLADTYAQIIKMLLAYGDVLTEHVADNEVLSNEKASFSDSDIYLRDTSWLEESDLVVAEVSVPSLGVGFEIAHAKHNGKPILCLYNRKAVHNLSAMISGCPDLDLVDYEEVRELELPIKKFIKNFSQRNP